MREDDEEVMQNIQPDCQVKFKQQLKQEGEMNGTLK